MSRSSKPDNLARVVDALSSHHWKWSFPSGSNLSGTVVELLTKNLPHISPDSWPDRLNYGGIYVNGKMVFQDVEVMAPCWIEYFEPKFDISEAGEKFPSFREEYILMRDEDMLVVFKPRGLPVLPNREQTRFTLKTYLQEYLARGNGDSETQAATLHLPSRLDTSTAGILIASISKRMHAQIQRCFERRLIDKYYLLEVLGEVKEKELRVNAPIARDPRHPVLRRIDSHHGQEAITEFRVVRSSTYLAPDGQSSPATVLEAKLLTGRTHQIRVHAANTFGPIIGDNFYNGPPAESLHLLSYRICVKHPFRNESIDVRVPPELSPSWAI